MTTKKFDIGDSVSVLDEAIDGIVVAVKNNEITIKTSDDFVLTYFVNELVKINNTNDLNKIIKSETLVHKSSDIQPKKKQNMPTFKTVKVERGIPEFDLHIEKLVKNFRGMSSLTS